MLALRGRDAEEQDHRAEDSEQDEPAARGPKSGSTSGDAWKSEFVEIHSFSEYASEMCK